MGSFVRNQNLPPNLPLRHAIRDGDTESVRRLLDDGCSPNDEYAVSPLGHATARGEREIVQLLIDHGADLNWRNPFTGWSALTIADANEFIDLAADLEVAGISRTSRLAHGYTTLHRAARRGEVHRALDEADLAAINALDAEGDTPLTLAIHFRHEGAARALLRAGADPNYVNDGHSVLGDAAYEDSVLERNTDFLGLLLPAGADPNPAGYPPLFMTVNQEGSSAKALRRLVSAGADIAAVTLVDGETVLHRIACIGAPDLIDAAVDSGAPIEARDLQGRTPVLVAASASSIANFVRLAALGADLGARDWEGNSIRDMLEDTSDLAEADEIRRLIIASERDPTFAWSAWPGSALGSAD